MYTIWELIILPIAYLYEMNLFQRCDFLSTLINQFDTPGSIHVYLYNWFFFRWNFNLFRSRPEIAFIRIWTLVNYASYVPTIVPANHSFKYYRLLEALRIVLRVLLASESGARLLGMGPSLHYFFSLGSTAVDSESVDFGITPSPCLVWISVWLVRVWLLQIRTNATSDHASVCVYCNFFSLEVSSNRKLVCQGQ